MNAMYRLHVLARWWNSEPNSYARVFSYDEEGRLTKIERDYGNGNLQLAYEYGYNGDGIRVWKRDTLSQQEYRYLCRMGCGGVPMQVYSRAIGGTSWASVEDYLSTRTITFYSNSWGNYIDVEVLYVGRALVQIDADRAPILVYTDLSNRVVHNRIIPIPYLDYWQSDANQPIVLAVPAWVVPAVIAAAGIAAVAWCFSAAMTLAVAYEQAIKPGNDKLKHCLAGCFARPCTPVPPIGIGHLFEHFQGITTGYDHDWIDDALATDIGVVIGAVCMGMAFNPNLSPILGILGGYTGCCVLGCREAFGGYYQGGGLYN